MKGEKMEFPEKCEHRYRSCVERDICDVRCNGDEKNHPYCKFVSYCRFLDKEPMHGFCDGRCEYNKRLFEIHKLDETLDNFWKAKNTLDKIIEDLENERNVLKEENKVFEDNHKNEEYEFFDYEREEDDQD